MGFPYLEIEFSTTFPYYEMVLSALFSRISTISATLTFIFQMQENQLKGREKSWK